MSPSKFPSSEGFLKKFRLWIAGEGQVGVKRLPDVAVSEGDSNEGDAEGDAE